MQRVLFLLIFILSCASSVEKKVNLKSVSIPDKNFSVYYQDHFIKNRSRSIASVSYESLSIENKYFLTLYNQFNRINKITNSNISIKACPQFHHQLVTAKKEKVRTIPFSSINFHIYKENPKSLIHNPSLGLNYGSDLVYSYLSKKNMWSKANKVVKVALKKHNESNLREIKELCESGFSKGFYAYQNMVKFYNHKSFSYSKRSMPAFLKIPVLANILVLSNYSQNYSVYEQEVLSSLNIDWFKDYIKEIKSFKSGVSFDYYSQR